MSKRLNVLFATNFSAGSKLAIKTIKLLQKKNKLNLSMIYVVEAYWRNWTSSGLYQKEATSRLAAWQKEYLKFLDPKKMYTKVGNTADHILETARKIKANLIMLGGKLTDEAGRYKSGVVIESVVRHAETSVWICKKETINRVLCGVDGSPTSAEALQYALDLCKQFSAKLAIVHALPNYLPPFGMSERTIRKEEEKLRETQIEHIQALLKGFNFEGVETETIFQWGKPANVILDHAEDFNYDLIVIGAKGDSYFRYLMLGSTAEKIMRYTPCSLLVVR